MIKILPLRLSLQEKIAKYSLHRKFEKQCRFFSQNVQHPGLRVERLEPKTTGLYSFRIDRKFRAIFYFYPTQEAIEIVDITVHYQ